MSGVRQAAPHTGIDGRKVFRIGGPESPGPQLVQGFNVDDDVLLVDRPQLSRADLTISPRGADTVVAVNDEELAIVEGVPAADLDPLPFVARLYEAMGRGDTDGVLALMADDVVLEAPGPADLVPWAGRWEGLDGVREFLHRIGSAIQVDRFAPTRFIAQGNTVAVVIDERGTSRSSGVSYQGGLVHWITVRGGRIAALQSYLDTFPIVEAILGGRPFTVPATEGRTYYVVVPVASRRTTDSIIFDPAGLTEPPETVKVVRRMYTALQALDVPKVREVFAPDVLWDIFGPPDLLSWAGPCHGPDEAAESANQILATMHFDHFKPTRMICQGDTVAVTIDEGGTSTAAGLAFSTSVVHVVSTNAESRVALFRNYINTTEIVEAFLGGRPFTVNESGDHHDT